MIGIILLAVTLYIIYFWCSYIMMPFFLRGFCSFVGLRGCGKSNLASCLAQYWIKKGKEVYSNFPIKGCKEYDVTDLGTYEIKDCVLILDEAGIDMSNRKILEKSMKGIKENNRRFWKLTRHYGISNIFLFSQAFDYDITLRRLCDAQYILTPSRIKNWTLITLLRQYWDVTEDGDSPQVKMEILKFPHMRCWRKPWFKYYDSYAIDELPNKEFNYYTFDNTDINKQKEVLFSRLRRHTGYYKRLEKKIKEKYLKQDEQKKERD